MFVPVVPGCENRFAKAARIAGDAGEVDALKVILNVLLPVVHFSTKVAFKAIHTTSLLQKPLARSSQTTDGPFIAFYVLLMFTFELIHEMVNHPIVEVLSAKVGIASCRFNFKNTILNGKNGDIKSASTKIKYQDI